MMWLYLNLRRITFLRLLLLLGSILGHEWSLVQIIRVIVIPCPHSRFLKQMLNAFSWVRGVSACGMFLA